MCWTKYVWLHYFVSRALNLSCILLMIIGNSCLLVLMAPPTLPGLFIGYDGLCIVCAQVGTPSNRLLLRGRAEIWDQDTITTTTWPFGTWFPHASPCSLNGGRRTRPGLKHSSSHNPKPTSLRPQSTHPHIAQKENHTDCYSFTLGYRRLCTLWTLQTPYILLNSKH